MVWDNLTDLEAGQIKYEVHERASQVVLSFALIRIISGP